jgi:Flp pilus assembly protein TadG
MSLMNGVDGKTMRRFVNCLNGRFGAKTGGDESGATMVELALSASILLAMFLGVTQVSIALYANDFLSQAAREGSRWAIVRGGSSCTNTPTLDHCGALDSDIQTHVRSLGFPFANSVNVSVTWLAEKITLDANAVPSTTWVANCTSSNTVVCPNGSTGNNSPGNQVKVTVRYNYSLNIPYWGNAALPMASTSAMVISQ